MNDLKNPNKNKAVRSTVKHISKFLIVGVSAVMVDLVTYYFFSSFIQVDISKSMGFICGSVFTYYFNKKWTWRHKEKTNQKMIVRFAIIYGISLICNVLINKFVLQLAPNYYFSATLTNDLHVTTSLASFKVDKFIAFMCATAFSAVFNFFGQKLWVFKSVTQPEFVVSVEEVD